MKKTIPNEVIKEIKLLIRRETLDYAYPNLVKWAKGMKVGK